MTDESLYELKGRLLRAKHRDGQGEVVVDVDAVLVLFSERDRAIRRAKKYRWLYRRQRGHLRKLLDREAA